MTVLLLPFTIFLCCLVLVASSRLGIDPYVRELVAEMTLEEQIGQMMQLNIDEILRNGSTAVDEDKLRRYLEEYKIGSILNTPFAGGPVDGKYGWTAQEWRDVITTIQRIATEQNVLPLIYGIDSVHGANYVNNAVIFGHQINAAATFNPELVYEMGHITGKDTVAAGIPWLFSPVLGIATAQKWARVYETFGEDPYLASVMGENIVKGIQSNDNVAACMKHFIAYSKPQSGHDRDNVVLSDYDILNYYAPPFIAAQKAGVLSAMEGYHSINGEPVVASPKYLNDLLRKDMGFEGLLVTDWGEINNLLEAHHVVSSKKEAAKMCLKKSTVDMSMVPSETTFFSNVLELVQEGELSRERIRDSVERIVQLKYTLGLFEAPVPGQDKVDSVGSLEDEQTALDIARESLVLLKNKDSVLPIQITKRFFRTPSIFLTGHAADSIGHLCGGWSVAWQGISGNDGFTHGSSIKAAIKKIIKDKNMKFTLKHASMEDRAQALSMARSSKYTIVTIGEDPYTEKFGDINQLSIDQEQLDYVRELAKTGTKIIVVLVEGRPRLLHDIVELADAVVHTFLPCEMGGQAIAEVLFGFVNPSGRMPLTYSKDDANIDIPYYHLANTQCFYGKYCEMQWQFGEGLSYTTFAYEKMALNVDHLQTTGKVSIALSVTNTGRRAGKETVLLFVSDPVREMKIPEMKLLKKFTKVFLQAGETRRVTFELTRDDLGVYGSQIGESLTKVTEKGSYFVSFGYDTTCGLYQGKQEGPCKEFTLT